MMSAKEIWLTIKQNNNYEVSNLGNVRNAKTKRVLKPSISNKGYYLVALSNNGKSHTYTVHKLVIEHFNRCAFSNEVVNHKDHNKLNNCIENLEWCTQKENIKDAYSSGLCENAREQAKINILKASKSQAIKIAQLNKNHRVLKIWDSAREIDRSLNINNANIISCCKGERKSAGGFLWRYADEIS